MPARYVAPTLAALARRRSHSRLVKKAAYRLAEMLGDSVLVGRTPGGSRMALSMRDHQHRHIYFYGDYEPATTALIRRLVVPGFTVFDVGANAGYFSLLCCELDAGAVHCFEPNPTVCRLLSRSASAQSSNIEVVGAACSDHEGTMPLYLSDPGNTGLSSLNRITENPVDVDVITLDGYARRSGIRPDFIKIDVEGHEREVLVGAQWLLETARPVVIAEIAEASRDDLVELMEGYGYVPRRILADGSTGVHGSKLTPGEPENICFMPSPQLPPTPSATESADRTSTQSDLAS